MHVEPISRPEYLTNPLGLINGNTIYCINAFFYKESWHSFLGATTLIRS